MNTKPAKRGPKPRDIAPGVKDSHRAWITPLRDAFQASGLTCRTLASQTATPTTKALVQSRVSEMMRGVGDYPRWESVRSVYQALVRGGSEVACTEYELREHWRLGAEDLDKSYLWIDRNLREAELGAARRARWAADNEIVATEPLRTPRPNVPHRRVAALVAGAMAMAVLAGIGLGYVVYQRILERCRGTDSSCVGDPAGPPSPSVPPPPGPFEVPDPVPPKRYRMPVPYLAPTVRRVSVTVMFRTAVYRYDWSGRPVAEWDLRSDWKDERLLLDCSVNVGGESYFRISGTPNHFVKSNHLITHGAPPPACPLTPYRGNSPAWP
ncbi:hypothetical protein [Streptomyces virginiae]